MRIRHVLGRFSDDDWQRLASDASVSMSDARWPDELTAFLAEAIRFRPTTLRRADRAQRARLVRRALGALDERQLVATLFVVHALARPELEARVRAAIGHPGATLDGGDEPLPADFDVNSAAARILRLEGEVPPADVQLMVAACLPEWRMHWQGAGRLVEAIEAAFADRPAPTAAGARREAEPAGAEPADAGGVDPEPDVTAADAGLRDIPSFSKLDRVMIRATVSALNGVIGSLERDDLDDLVNEILEMNDARHQSWFHRGYLDALFARDVPAIEPGINRERRSWLLVGYFLGLLRRSPTADVLSRLAALPSADRDILLTGSPTGAGAMLAREIIVPLLEAGQVDQALAWMQPYPVAVAPRVVNEVLEWARHELIRGDAASVRRVLETIRQRQTVMSSVHGELPDHLRRALRRRLAIALRCEGRFREAERLVDDLLDDCQDAAERANLLSDRALLAMGVGRIETLALPEEGARESFLASIERARAALDRAAEAESPAPTALVVLAMPALASRQVPEETRLTAIHFLRTALDVMSAEHSTFWMQSGLLSRCRFYLSVLELRSLNHALALLAAERARQLLEEGVGVPPDLLEEVVEHAVLMDAPAAAEVARLAFERQPHRILARLDVTSLVKGSPAFRRAVVAFLAQRAEAMNAGERWSSWQQVLRGCIDAAERDIDVASQALDSLEELAQCHGMAAEFLTLLEDRSRWDPAWSLAEASEARARLYEGTGRLPEARAVLRDLAHAAITDGQPTLARDLREKIEQLGEEPHDLQDIDQRLGSIELARIGFVAERRALPRRTRVFFLGGDEHQQAYEPRLRELLAESHPEAVLSFEFPGWDSNWGRTLDRIEGRILQSDAVVLMRFVRTMLGRHVRKLVSGAGIPWVACTGHGLESLRRSIERAAKLATLRVEGG